MGDPGTSFTTIPPDHVRPPSSERQTSKSPSEVYTVLGPHGCDDLLRQAIAAAWREHPEETRTYAAVRQRVFETWTRNLNIWRRIKKPDPRVFLHCADRQRSHGYAPEDWLHVAQSQYHDIAAASRLGVATCWIERRAGQDGFGATPTPEEVTKPDYRFTSLHELAAAVAS